MKTAEDTKKIRNRAMQKALRSDYFSRPNPAMEKGEELRLRLRSALDHIPTADLWHRFAKKLKA